MAEDELSFTDLTIHPPEPGEWGPPPPHPRAGQPVSYWGPFRVVLDDTVPPGEVRFRYPEGGRMDLFETLVLEAIKAGLELRVSGPGRPKPGPEPFNLELGTPGQPVGSVVLFASAGSLEEASQKMLKLLLERLKPKEDG